MFIRSIVAFVAVASLVVMSGCAASQSTLQHDLDQARQEKVELTAQLTALRGQKSTTENVCEISLTKLHEAAVATENAAKAAYDASLPVIIHSSEWAKQKIEAQINGK